MQPDVQDKESGRAHRAGLLWCALGFLVCGIGAGATAFDTPIGGAVAGMAPAAILLLLMLAPRPRWLPVVGGAMAAMLGVQVIGGWPGFGRAGLAAAACAPALVLGPLVGAGATYRLARGRPRVSSLHDMLCLLVGAGVASLLIAAVEQICRIAGGLPASWNAVLADSAAAAAAMCVLPPLGLAMVDAPRDRPVVFTRLAEMIGLELVLIASTLVVFDPVLREWFPHVRPYAMFPAICLVAWRLGPGGVAAGGVLVAAVALGATLQDRGPLAELYPPGPARLAAAHLLVAVVSATGLLLASAIAERGRLMGELARSRDRLDLAIRSARQSIWDWDVLADRTYWSEDLARQLGCQPCDEGGGFTWSECLHPDDRERAERAVAAHLERSEPYDVEYRLRMRDGSYRWFRSVGRAVRDQAGRAVRMVGVMADVQERRVAEERVRISEERFRSVFEQHPHPMWVFDVDSLRVLCVNQAAVMKYGYPREQFEGMSLLELRDEAEAKRLQAFLRDEYDVNVGYEGVWRHRTATGRSIDMLVSTRPIPWEAGRRTGLSTCIDMTDKLAAERALEESRERYRAFVVHSTEGIWRTAVDPPVSLDQPEDDVIEQLYERSRVAECNEAMARMYGLTGAAELVGTPLAAMLPREDPRNIEYLRALIRGGRLTDAESYKVDIHGNPRSFLNNLVAIVENGCVSAAWGTQRDVTDKKAAEAALKKSEARYRRLLNDVRVIAWEADPATWRFTFVAGQAHEILGYTPEQWLEDGFWARTLHPEDRARAVSFCMTKTAEGEDHDFEYRAIRADGRVVWLRDLVSVETDDAGRPVLLRGVMIDITASREAEEALRRSEGTKSAILAAIPDAMFRVDRKGRYLDYSGPPGARLLLPPERFLNRTVREVLPPHLAEQCMRAVEETLSSGEGRAYEYTVGHGERTRFWEVRVVKVASAEEALLLVRDVTAQRHAERALRESQRRLSLLVSQAPVGVIVWNTRFEVVQWNPAAEQMFGFSAQEAIGRRGTLIVPSEGRSQAMEMWQALMEQRGGRHSINENLTKSGERIVCEWHNTPLLGPDGSSMGVASFVQDVTERVMSERRQALMMQELDHRVKNNLAAVLSLAEQTGRSAASLEEFNQTFLGRVRALARMHGVLATSRWRGADLRSIILQMVEPYSGRGPGRLTLDGPEVTLSPRTAQSLAMTFNELATNAAKYGALSAAGGRIEVRWSVEDVPEDEPPIVHMEWRESGGPVVKTPERQGLGLELIEGAIVYQLGGRVEFGFEAPGLWCRISAPLGSDPAPASAGQPS